MTASVFRACAEEIHNVISPTSVLSGSMALAVEARLERIAAAKTYKEQQDGFKEIRNLYEVQLNSCSVASAKRPDMQEAVKVTAKYIPLIAP